MGAHGRAPAARDARCPPLARAGGSSRFDPTAQDGFHRDGGRRRRRTCLVGHGEEKFPAHLPEQQGPGQSGPALCGGERAAGRRRSKPGPRGAELAGQQGQGGRGTRAARSELGGVGGGGGVLSRGPGPGPAAQDGRRGGARRTLSRARGGCPARTPPSPAEAASLPCAGRGGGGSSGLNETQSALNEGFVPKTGRAGGQVGSAVRNRLNVASFTSIHLCSDCRLTLQGPTVRGRGRQSTQVACPPLPHAHPQRPSHVWFPYTVKDHSLVLLYIHNY